MSRYINVTYILLLISGLFFTNLNCYSQKLPEKVYQNQSDYSFMWWLNTIKANNKSFAIKTNNYALSFDYPSLTISNFLISGKKQDGDVVLREKNEDSFTGSFPCKLDFGMDINGTINLCRNTTGNIDDCQLIESGKYFQRRFINKLVDLKNCDQYNSGLEISSWPDRLTILLKVTPSIDLENTGLFMSLTLPSKFNKILEKGDVKALRNPEDGSGYVILQSTNSSKIEINGTTIKVLMEKKPLSQKGKEISTGIIIYPVTSDIDTRLNEIAEQENVPVTIKANQVAPTNQNLKVVYDKDLGWHKIGLRNDGIAGNNESKNNRIERVKLELKNENSQDKCVRFNFAKGRLSSSDGSVFSLTGISSILRDSEGNPVGIPVQLSKNWHNSTKEDAKDQYFRGSWFHGLSMLTIPANSTIKIEYTGVNALWGGVPAASHAQLCLVGWGSNQQWDESAIGSWGESICYEPDLDQARAPLLDFRPLLVKSSTGQNWGWTGNMGGADFVNYTKLDGTRSWHNRMRTLYKRYCPNLTEVTYAGNTDDEAIDLEYTASISRSDDITRGFYNIKLYVTRDIEFKDFVVFQAAAPFYHYSQSNTLTWGDEKGLKKQWMATVGKTPGYITEKQVAEGEVPWFSFTDSQIARTDFLPANRAFVIRNWKARINGKDNVPPSFAEYNAVGGHGESSSIINLTPPPDCTSFKKGDFIEAVIELFLIPKFASDYYGPNQNLINALSAKSNSWELVYREAVGNNPGISVSDGGTLLSKYPIKIESNKTPVCFSVTGGLGYVPIMITGVGSFKNPVLYKKVDGTWQKINQQVHGNDFWQSDYDHIKNKWDITFNVNLDTPNDIRQTVEFKFDEEEFSNTSNQTETKVPEIKIFPNPTHNNCFWIDIPMDGKIYDTSIIIKDSTGRTVYHKDDLNESPAFLKVNLNTGIYLVTASNKESSMTGKLIIDN